MLIRHTLYLRNPLALWGHDYVAAIFCLYNLYLWLRLLGWNHNKCSSSSRCQLVRLALDSHILWLWLCWWWYLLWIWYTVLLTVGSLNDLIMRLAGWMNHLGLMRRLVEGVLWRNRRTHELDCLVWLIESWLANYLRLNLTLAVMCP